MKLEFLTVETKVSLCRHHRFQATATILAWYEEKFLS